jgi:hypothetical protein
MLAPHFVRALRLIAVTAMLTPAVSAAQSGDMIEQIFNAEGSNFGVAFIKTREVSKVDPSLSFNGVGIELRAIYKGGAIYLSGVSLESPRDAAEPAATLGFEWLPLQASRFAAGIGGLGTMTQVDGPDGKQAWLTLGGGASAYFAVTRSFILGVSYNALNSDLDGARSQLVARIMLVP